MLFQKIKNLYAKYQEGFWHFIKFQCVGVINFLVDFGVLTLLNVVLGWPLVLSNIFSYTCGVVNSYIFNRFWTFKMKLKFFSAYKVTLPMRTASGEKRVIHPGFLSVDFLKFIFVNLVSLGVNTLAVYILGDLYGLPNIWSKIIATVFSFTINFAGNKLLVFRSKPTEKKETE